jgi:hypothetical protein
MTFSGDFLTGGFMKKIRIRLVAHLACALAMVLAIGLAFTSCDNGSTKTGYDPIVHESYKGSTTYKLEITKNTGKAAFTPAAGDFFKLTITKSGAVPKVSSGTIQSVTGGNTFTLIHSGGGTFSITMSTNGGMTSIVGTIPFDDGTTETGPGGVTTTPPEDGTTGGGGNPGGGNNGKKIIITGLTGKTGRADLQICNEDKYVAIGQGTISGGSLTFSLREYSGGDNVNNGLIGNSWTGSGSYYFVLQFYADNTWYVYTNGKSLAELGITDTHGDAIISKLPTYNISSDTSTIPFSQFCYGGEAGGGSDSGDGGGVEPPTETGDDVNLSGSTWVGTGVRPVDEVFCTFVFDIQSSLYSHLSSQWVDDKNNDNGWGCTFTVSGNTVTFFAIGDQSRATFEINGNTMICIAEDDKPAKSH